MKTSERKNAKRIRALMALKETSLEHYEAEMERLFQAWSDEVWRRVKDRTLPSAGELIRIASPYGLEKELAGEVIKAVARSMGGPGFPSRSVIRPKGMNQADAVETWKKVWGTEAR